MISKKLSAARLKLALLKKGMTLADLARMAVIDYPYLRNIACGYSTSRVTHKKIENFLGEPIWSE